ncbi:MAG TPA: SPOR domain-containing protein [Syntrophales bacterium]|nr:SPOR domain-containing protein [Syntrophales bacterium]
MDKRVRMMKAVISYGRIVVIYLAVFIFVPVIYEMKHEGDTFSWSVNLVSAQPRSTETIPVTDETKPTSIHEKSLMDNLLEKQKQLDNREKLLKEEERKIEELKKEVSEKMEALRVLQESMLPALEVQKAEKEKKYQVLAKMYEVTPPEKAAVIFEKMDRKMAAEIMLRMSSKKAGAVWAQINRDAGIEIIKEITSSQSVDTASAVKIAKEITEQAASKPEAVQTSNAVSTTTKDKEIAGAGKNKQVPIQMMDKKSSSKKEPKAARLKKANLENVKPRTFKPFAIQIKAVRGIDMAREYTKVLKEEGIDAYWSEMNVKGSGTLYRILVGHFASREEALNYMKNKRIDSNYPGSYIRKGEQEPPTSKKKRQ